jgi:hypothetical protein
MKRKIIIQKGDTIDTVVRGSEPQWKTKEGLTGKDLMWEILKAQNWYRGMADNSDLKKWLLEWMKKNGYDKETIQLCSVGGVFDYDSGSYCRMATLGLKLPKEYTIIIEKNITRLKMIGENKAKNRAESAEQADEPRESLQERVKRVTGDYLADMNAKLDSGLEDIRAGKKPSFSMSEWLVTKKVKPIYCQAIADEFNKISREVQDAIDGVDKDLVEGYSFLKKKDLVKFSEFISDIVYNANQFATLGKKMKKPRKKKAKSPEKQVEKVKYQKEDSDLGVISLDPVKIIGSTRLITYNTKYKSISYYEISPLVTGFAIKGTSIVGFDEKKSYTKKLRKPKDVLKSMLGGIRQINNALNSLKTKQAKANGRLNENTIILQALK